MNRTSTLCVAVAGAFAVFQTPIEAGLVHLSQIYSTPGGRTDAYSFGLSSGASASSIFVGERFVSAGQFQSGLIHQYDRATGAYMRPIYPPSPILPNQAFGRSIAVSGNEVLVGPIRSDQAAIYDTSKTPTQPLSEPARILTPSSSTFESNGAPYAVLHLGNRVVISSPGDDTLGFDAGAVHVFDSSGIQTTLYSSSPTDAGSNYLGGQFGQAIAGAGGKLFITERLVEAGSGTTISGAVHIADTATGFVRQFLVSPGGAQSNDHFGESIAEIGGMLAVGAPWAVDPQNGRAHAGVVYVFDSSTGEPLRMIANPDPTKVTDFGASIAVVNGQLVIGGTASNSVYVVEPKTGAVLSTINTPRPVLNSDAPGSSYNNSVFKQFGVSIAAAGSSVLIGEGGIGDAIGVPRELVRPGAVYEYQIADNIAELAILTDSVEWTLTGDGGLLAQFTPRFDLSLSDAAKALGVDHFNWVQVVNQVSQRDLFETPGFQDMNGLPLSSYDGSTMRPFFDPIPGGYSYQGATPGHPVMDDLPFYWDEEFIGSDVGRMTPIPGLDRPPERDLDFVSNDNPTNRTLLLTDGSVGYNIDAHSLMFIDRPNTLYGDRVSFTLALAGVYADGTYKVFDEVSGLQRRWWSERLIGSPGDSGLLRNMLPLGGPAGRSGFDTFDGFSREEIELIRRSGGSVSDMVVPEPSSVMMLAIGCAVVVGVMAAACDWRGASSS